mmetsp:Transcript_3243/g.7051  ORF Transcript_3243/g.7051 Transcript_3243/m.7051 type:complete len:214 (-) Transcript_3243:201-842(-)
MEETTRAGTLNTVLAETSERLGVEGTLDVSDESSALPFALPSGGRCRFAMESMRLPLAPRLASGTNVPFAIVKRMRSSLIHIGGITPHSKCSGTSPRKRTSCGSTHSLVLLKTRNVPPPTSARWGVFQKPLLFLFDMNVSTLGVSARTRANGMLNPSVQFGQNLFLKCALPGLKPLTQQEESPLASAPQQRSPPSEASTRIGSAAKSVLITAW